MDDYEFVKEIAKATNMEEFPTQYVIGEGGFWQDVSITTNFKETNAVKFSSGKILDRDGWRKPKLEVITNGNPINFKYNEAVLVEEFRSYLASTYKGHYVGEDNVQSLDLIFAAKAGWGFCQGNVLKYAGPRLGIKNDGKETRADILKVLHYALLMLYLLDKGKK